MTHKLVSFLGRGFYRPDASRTDYRVARYEFVDNQDGRCWASPPSTQFAHAAYLWHQQPGMQPFDSVVILGTSGSMWDALADSFGGDAGRAVSETVLTVSDLVDRQDVPQHLLDRYAVELSQQSGVDVRLLLIPSATDAASQSGILRQIDHVVADGDRLWLDVTHGYRHLPMIGLAAACLAATLRAAEIEEIAYGALEMTRDGLTPVISLKWILQLLRVLSGLNELSHRQSLRPLIGCFPQGKVRGVLEDASYKLDVMRIDEAARAVREGVQLLDLEQDDLPLELALVSGTIRNRLEQFGRQRRTIKGLTEMARLALQEDEFVHASIYLAEAVGLAADKDVPGDADEDRRLKKVRNWLVHAGQLRVRPEDRDVRQLVANRSQLRRFLQSHIDRLWQDARQA